MVSGRYCRDVPAEAIRYAVGRCALGLVLVAASGRGICAVELGDDPAALRQALARRFPVAVVEEAGADFGATVARVVAFLDRPQGEFGLPLDLRGTAFQQQVWQALQAIPPGTTLSYRELAVRLGRPTAARAVAGAVAANPVAVVIPCHRVVRGDGGLGGYRWGVARKRALLQAEEGGG